MDLTACGNVLAIVKSKAKPKQAKAKVKIELMCQTHLVHKLQLLPSTNQPIGIDETTSH